MTIVIHLDVRIAISIPDDLFRAAENHAERMKVSRSEFYQRAIESFIEEQNDRKITEQLNKVYSKIEPKVMRAQRRSTFDNQEDW